MIQVRNIAFDQHLDSFESSRQAKPRPKFPISINRWWLELLGALATVLCVIAIVVVFAKFDGELISSWDISISLSATISILSTASKAFMVSPASECISQLKWLQLAGNEHG